MGIAITPLKRPIHIGKRLAKNRFVIQPMECGDANLRGGFSVLKINKKDTHS